jgi:hypothetical protein
MTSRLRRAAVLGAGSLVLALAGTAASEPSGGGSPCAMTLAVQNGAASGTVWGGPWTAAAVAVDPGATDTITLACSVQYSATPGGTDLARVERTGTGAVVLPPAAVSFLVSSTTLYLCTEVTVVHDGATSVYQYDADADATNGVQCATAVSAGVAGGELVSVPPVSIRMCITVEDPENGQRRDLVCLPCGIDCLA